MASLVTSVKSAARRSRRREKKTEAQRTKDALDKMNNHERIADKEQQCLDLLDDLRNEGFTDNFLRAVRDNSGIPEALAGLAIGKRTPSSDNKVMGWPCNKKPPWPSGL